MKFITKSVIALAVASSFAFSAAAQDKTGWPETVAFGTGSQGGSYFAYGSGFAGLISEKLGLNASVEVTGGPGQNVTLVQTGDLSMGFVTMGPAYDAWVGKSEVMPGVEHTAVRAMFPMYQTPLQAAVLASSGIKSFKDMEGKRIGVGPASGTSAAYWPRYFKAAGMDVNISYAGASDTAGQLKDGLIDAFVYAAGIPNGAYTQLAVENDVVFISMTEEERAMFLQAEPAMSAFTSPGQLDQPDPVEQSRFGTSRSFTKACQTAWCTKSPSWRWKSMSACCRPTRLQRRPCRSISTRTPSCRSTLAQPSGSRRTATRSPTN